MVRQKQTDNPNCPALLSCHPCCREDAVRRRSTRREKRWKLICSSCLVERPLPFFSFEVMSEWDPRRQPTCSRKQTPRLQQGVVFILAPLQPQARAADKRWPYQAAQLWAIPNVDRPASLCPGFASRQTGLRFVEVRVGIVCLPSQPEMPIGQKKRRRRRACRIRPCRLLRM
ncbi:hypothetical protein LZ30DRAFT_60841 [Colletotrichum cereale]|nr:hypothetical protein LZ30DRAFT_60841 [Colletotrichum cereale]